MSPVVMVTFNPTLTWPFLRARSTDADCSYNGQCTAIPGNHMDCICDAAWIGERCQTLNLQPAKPAAVSITYTVASSPLAARVTHQQGCWGRWDCSHRACVRWGGGRRVTSSMAVGTPPTAERAPGANN